MYNQQDVIKLLEEKYTMYTCILHNEIISESLNCIQDSTGSV